LNFAETELFNVGFVLYMKKQEESMKKAMLTLFFVCLSVWLLRHQKYMK